MEENKNVSTTDYGYEITWITQESYGGKILVFEKPFKTEFWFNNKTEKSWFVNNGSFVFRWIDTSNGQLFQQEAKEGFVFTAKPLVPCAIECTSPGSLSEVNNGYFDNDKFIVIHKGGY
jgi:hypothetical protein